MASQGKFVSVNLNKSYGRPVSSSGYATSPSNSTGNGSRPRSGGGGGGGMVVLSRPRSSVSAGQKGGPRLSVPPPMNLPSLRKEHERFDTSATAGRSAGSGSSGLGHVHGPQGIGWTRTSAQPPSALREDAEKSSAANQPRQTVYAAPNSQSRAHLVSAPIARELSTEVSAPALRGEDFPSLLATFESSKKRREAMNQKPKQKAETQDLIDLQPEKSGTQPRMQPSGPIDDKRPSFNVGSMGKESSQLMNSSLPEPLSLPIVHLSRRSDWADDERDTGIGILGRERERGLPRGNAGHFDDFFIPARDYLRTDSYGRDSTASNRDARDAGSWRGFPHSTDGLASRECLFDRGMSKEMVKEGTAYGQSPLLENGYQDSWLNRRGGITPPGRRDGDSQKSDHYGDRHAIQNRVNVSQNTHAPRTPFSPGTKGLNLPQDRRIFPNSSTPYVDDTIFDGKGPFSGDLSGDVSMKIIKRKKDASKQAEFYDPIRESFEVELQRVQQLQEMERQRALEEQTRAVELARKEEEERERLAREEEEQRTKLEEEAREAACRAEQERLEASMKAEEQRIAREEEKRRILMEEERRKEAAREKLLELEAQIARRQAEAASKDVKDPSVSGDERSIHTEYQKNGESLVGSNGGNSDLAAIDRIFEAGSKTLSPQESNPSFAEKGRHVNPWRKDSSSNTLTISSHDQESSSQSLKRDVFGAGRALPRKDFFGSPNSTSVRSSSRGISENGNTLNDPRHSRDHRWNFSSEIGDVDAEFLENDGDVGWRHSRSSGELHSGYPPFPNADVDGVSSFGRSRNSLRQPRVLPPPISSVQRRPFRDAAVSYTEAKYQNGKADDLSTQTRYENRFEDQVDEPVIIPSLEKLAISLEKDETSQSSLSVTSPPSSPTHLSHDDLEDSVDSPSRERLAFSDVDHRGAEVEAGEATPKMSPSLISLGEDDEWEIENSGAVQDQEEYDEDNGYREEDEAHDGDDENHDQIQLGSYDESPDKNSGTSQKDAERRESGSGTESNPLLEARESSPKTWVDSENAMNELGVEPLTSVSVSMDSAPMTSSIKPSVSSVSALPSQAEVPVKVQFGLFSGPSLIPPPVPAIQIGSIQMPLHLHPPVAPLAQVHSSQSPFFQFGQMRYPSIPQSLMPFVHPTLPTHYSLTQSQRMVGQDSSFQNVQINDGQTTSQTTSSVYDVRQDKRPAEEVIASSDVSKIEECQAEGSTSQESRNESEVIASLGQQSGKDLQGPISMPDQRTSFRLDSNEKMSKGMRFPNASGGRGKRYVYKVKNSTSSRALLPVPDDFPQEPNNSQRRFSQNTRRGDVRPREPGRKQVEAMELVNPNEKQNLGGRMKRDTLLNKSSKSTVASEGKMVKALAKEASSKRNISTIIDSPKRNVILQEDVDAPLQSGIIRIFKQPGIEAPSDEDDFIEVRSKRQMLNDRREQREKQNKADSRVLKLSRKPRPVAHSNSNPMYSNKNGLPLGNMGRSKNASDLSTSHMASQPLAPIGTPSASVDADCRSTHGTKTSRSAPVPAVASEGTILSAGLAFDKNVTIDNIPTSLGPWSDSRIDQQVNLLTMTQSQVNEPMKPSRFEGHATSIAIEPEKLVAKSVKSQDEYSSSATSLSAVFPGERIQFGAVTTATVLPPLSRAVSRMSASEKESSPVFLEKEKRHEEPSIPLDDPEAEAEAAASAVAVAAISNDEVVSDGMGIDAAVSLVQEFEGGRRAVNSRSAAEESLTVALPADLSVETPALPLWPPLPGPQSSSGPMISCFPGGGPSHFPCYEMNPIIGGPTIFAFGGPNEEAPGAQAQQLQRAGPAHLGPWPACHSGVDSFYGSPAGFTGPFISPPVGIPGVQGPPHMVVYNHFTPVGQLGLGFMGAAYIPSGKQPDWKHSSTAASSNGNGNDNGNGAFGEGIGVGISSGQLRGASPLLPMASPLTMFDMSPFQPSGDMPIQARWSHLAPPPPLHSVPLSAVPLHQYQVDQAAPQFNASTATPSNSSAANAHFPHEHHPSRPDSTINFPQKSTSRFPVELGLVEGSQTATNPHQVSRHGAYSSPVRNNVKGPGGVTAQIPARNSSPVITAGQIPNMGPTIKTQPFQPPTAAAAAAQQQQYTQAIGPGAQRLGSGGDWYRRQGMHQGKNQQPSGTEKSFNSAKVKQIYVAKPAASGTSSSA